MDWIGLDRIGSVAYCYNSDKLTMYSVVFVSIGIWMMPPRKQPCKFGRGDGEKNKMVRGPAVFVDPPSREEDRPEIIIEGARFRREPYERDKELDLVIGQILKNYYPGGGSTSYKEWSDGLKDICFNEYQRHYKLHKDITEAAAKKLFNTLATRKLTKVLHEVRKAAKKKTKSDDPQDWVAAEPYWIQASDWKLLIQEWCKEYFQELSERNEQNRLASDDVAFATTGSLSIIDYKYIMMKENGMKEPKQLELFVRTHTKQSTGELVSTKAKKMQEDMNEAMRQKYGDDLSNHPSSDIDLWCKVTGGMPHGSLYGMGTSVDCRLRRSPRLFQPKCPAQTQSASKYIDEETVKKMLETQKAELEEKAKLREDKREQEAKLRENKREKRYIKQMRQAISDSQRSFMLAMLSFQNDGASTSRQSDRHNQASGSNNRGKLSKGRGYKAIWDVMLDSDGGDESDGSDGSDRGNNSACESSPSIK